MHRENKSPLLTIEAVVLMVCLRFAIGKGGEVREESRVFINEDAIEEVWAKM